MATVTSESPYGRWRACRVWHLKAVYTLIRWRGNISFCSIYKLKSEWSFLAKTDKSYCRIEFSVPHHNTMCASLRSSHCFKRISFLIKYLQRSFFFLTLNAQWSSHCVLRVSISTTSSFTVKSGPKVRRAASFQKKKKRKNGMKYTVCGRVSGRSSVLIDKLH